MTKKAKRSSQTVRRESRPEDNGWRNRTQRTAYGAAHGELRTLLRTLLRSEIEKNMRSEMDNHGETAMFKGLWVCISAR